MIKRSSYSKVNHRRANPRGRGSYGNKGVQQHNRNKKTYKATTLRQIQPITKKATLVGETTGIGMIRISEITLQSTPGMEEVDLLITDHEG